MRACYVYQSSLLIRSSLSFMLSVLFSSLMFSQSIDWVLEPIITDAEVIDLNLLKQDEINLISVWKDGKWGMKNAQNEVLAPMEFDAPQVWSGGKYFDMRLGKVQRYFDTEGYEVDRVEVKSHQKTISTKESRVKMENSLKLFKGKYDWLDFQELMQPNRSGIIALNKETGDTVCHRVVAKSFFVTNEKFSIQQTAKGIGFLLKDETGKEIEIYNRNMSISEFRSDRFIVRNKSLSGLLGDRGQVIL